MVTRHHHGTHRLESHKESPRPHTGMPGPLLDDVSPSEIFRARNGTVIHNIRELALFARTCSDRDFLAHIDMKSHRNDYADWIRTVIGDTRLAQALARETRRKPFTRKVLARIRETDVRRTKELTALFQE